MCDREVVELYLDSVDHSLFSAELQRIQRDGCSEYPSNLTEAVLWVHNTLNTAKSMRANCPSASNNKRRSESVLSATPTKKHKDGNQYDKKYGSPQYKQQSSSSERDRLPRCAVCKKRHKGGAQQCKYLDTLLKENPTLVSEVLEKGCPLIMTRIPQQNTHVVYQLWRTGTRRKRKMR